MEKKPLRTTMPNCAAFLDDLRQAFGAEVINDAIRRGLRGEPTFYAEEGGTSIGTRWDGTSYGPDPVTGQLVEKCHG